MTKEEKKKHKLEYLDVLDSLIGDTFWLWLLCFLGGMFLLHRDISQAWRMVILFLILTVSGILIVLNFRNLKQAKEMMSWDAYDAEIVGMEYVRLRHFDVTCQFTDKFGTVQKLTVKKARIPLTPKNDFQVRVFVNANDNRMFYGFVRGGKIHDQSRKTSV